MVFILSLLCAISSNLDTLAVSIAFGARKVAITWQAALSISAVTTFGTWAAMAFGLMVNGSIYSGALKLAGALILMGMGIWFVGTGLRPVGAPGPGFMISHPESADADNSGSIDFKESAALSFALAANNIGAGVAAGVAGLDISATTTCTFVAALLALWAGAGFGKSRLANWLGEYAPVVSGGLLFLAGLASAVV